jgi:intein/homing endonuclease
VHTCLAAGVVIETPAGPRPVETLREGDEVLSFDVDRGVQVPSRIAAVRTLSAPAILRFGELHVTGEHPVYTAAGWLPASELTAKSEVHGVDGKRFAIGEGERVDGETKVFCLAVAPPHTYFAAGVLVHNKDRGWSAKLDDPWYFYWGEQRREWTKVTK